MGNPITELSNAVTAVVERVGRSVVRVDAGRWSGFSGVVWSADGHVVTSSAALRRSDVSLTLPGGQEVAAGVVGRDPATDIALLKAEAEGLTAPDWAEPEGLKVGQVVLALGWPGKAVRATMGIVSNLGNEWRTPMGGRLERYVQPDAEMYPGFSGGPLADGEGRVLGMNTKALRRGLPLTVPAPTLRRVVEMLQKHGGVRRGYLGLSAQPVRLPEGAVKGLTAPGDAGAQGQEVGLLVVSVQEGGPAAKGGLMLGDVLLRVNAKPLGRMEDLLALLAELQAGAEVALELWRGGQTHDLRVTLGERQ